MEKLFNISHFPHIIEIGRHFLVPKSKKAEPEKLKLYQFINGNKLTMLTSAKMIEYINSHTDEKTKKIIFSNVRFRGLPLSNYIRFLKHDLTDDLSLDKINQQQSVVTDGGLSDSRRVDRLTQLMRLYWYCYMISKNEIRDAQVIFANDDEVIHRTYMMTMKFVVDYVGGLNKKDLESQSDQVALQRHQEVTRITKSTLISEVVVGDLSAEIFSLQNFYVYVDKLLDGIKERQKCIVEGVFCLTIREYLLSFRNIELSKSTKVAKKDAENKGRKYIENKSDVDVSSDDSPNRSRFFYSVAKIKDKYYIHHCAILEAKKDKTIQKYDWQLLETPDSGLENPPECYYTIKSPSV